MQPTVRATRRRVRKLFPSHASFNGGERDCTVVVATREVRETANSIVLRFRGYFACCPCAITGARIQVLGEPFLNRRGLAVYACWDAAVLHAA